MAPPAAERSHTYAEGLVVCKHFTAQIQVSESVSPGDDATRKKEPYAALEVPKFPRKLRTRRRTRSRPCAEVPRVDGRAR